MAKKEDKMIKLSKIQVKEREILVTEACRSLIEDDFIITYKLIEERTGIPCRSLERDPYRSIINTYKKNSFTESREDEFQNFREEIRRLNDIIKALRIQNVELKKKLLSLDYI